MGLWGLLGCPCVSSDILSSANPFVCSCPYCVDCTDAWPLHTFTIPLTLSFYIRSSPSLFIFSFYPSIHNCSPIPIMSTMSTMTQIHRDISEIDNGELRDAQSRGFATALFSRLEGRIEEVPDELLGELSRVQSDLREGLSSKVRLPTDLIDTL